MSHFAIPSLTLLLLSLASCAITPSDNAAQLNGQTPTPHNIAAGIHFYHQHHNVPASEYDANAYKYGADIDEIRIAIDGKVVLNSAQSAHFTCVICAREVNKTVDLGAVELSVGEHQLTVFINDTYLLAKLTSALLSEHDKDWKVFLQQNVMVNANQVHKVTILHSKRWKKASDSKQIFAKTFDGIELNGQRLAPKMD